MSAAARRIDSRSDTTPKPSAVDVFRERCEARAILVNACLFDLQDAVDGLQADAEHTGLAAEIGVDAVQRMLADAFAIVPRKGGNATLAKAIDDGFGNAKPTRPGAPPTTVEAVMYSLRQRGAAALAEADCRRRLSELTPDQLRQVIVRLDRMRSNYTAITDELLLRLGKKIS
jgi:hypothetical protein